LKLGRGRNGFNRRLRADFNLTLGVVEKCLSQLDRIPLDALIFDRQRQIPVSLLHLGDDQDHPLAELSVGQVHSLLGGSHTTARLVNLEILEKRLGKLERQRRLVLRGQEVRVGSQAPVIEVDFKTTAPTLELLGRAEIINHRVAGDGVAGYETRNAARGRREGLVVKNGRGRRRVVKPLRRDQVVLHQARVLLLQLDVNVIIERGHNRIAQRPLLDLARFQADGAWWDRARDNILSLYGRALRSRILRYDRQRD